MNPVNIWEVVPYDNKVSGKPMYSFNGGSIHLSAKQLLSKGVDVPELLQGTIMMVEFFQVGEILLNGQPVTEEGKDRIVKNFAVELDREVLKAVAIAKFTERKSVFERMRPARANITATNGDLAQNSQAGQQSAGVGSGPQTQSRNSQLDENGNPIADTAGDTDVTNAAGTTNASIGAAAEQVA